MNGRGERANTPPSGSGLCPRCAHVRAVHSDRGSTFLQCTLSKTNPRLPRYPPQPRIVCAGFEDPPARGSA